MSKLCLILSCLLVVALFGSIFGVVDGSGNGSETKFGQETKTTTYGDNSQITTGNYPTLETVDGWGGSTIFYSSGEYKYRFITTSYEAGLGWETPKMKLDYLDDSDIVDTLTFELLGYSYDSVEILGNVSDMSISAGNNSLTYTESLFPEVDLIYSFQNSLISEDFYISDVPSGLNESEETLSFVFYYDYPENYVLKVDNQTINSTGWIYNTTSVGIFNDTTPIYSLVSPYAILEPHQDLFVALNYSINYSSGSEFYLSLNVPISLLSEENNFPLHVDPSVTVGDTGIVENFITVAGDPISKYAIIGAADYIVGFDYATKTVIGTLNYPGHVFNDCILANTVPVGSVAAYCIGYDTGPPNAYESYVIEVLLDAVDIYEGLIWDLPNAAEDFARDITFDNAALSIVNRRYYIISSSCRFVDDAQCGGSSTERVTSLNPNTGILVELFDQNIVTHTWLSADYDNKNSQLIIGSRGGSLGVFNGITYSEKISSASIYSGNFRYCNAKIHDLDFDAYLLSIDSVLNRVYLPGCYSSPNIGLLLYANTITWEISSVQTFTGVDTGGLIRGGFSAIPTKIVYTSAHIVTANTGYLISINLDLTAFDSYLVTEGTPRHPVNMGFNSYLVVGGTGKYWSLIDNNPPDVDVILPIAGETLRLTDGLGTEATLSNYYAELYFRSNDLDACTYTVWINDSISNFATVTGSVGIGDWVSFPEVGFLYRRFLSVGPYDLPPEIYTVEAVISDGEFWGGEEDTHSVIVSQRPTALILTPANGTVFLGDPEAVSYTSFAFTGELYSVLEDFQSSPLLDNTYTITFYNGTDNLEVLSTSSVASSVFYDSVKYPKIINITFKGNDGLADSNLTWLRVYVVEDPIITILNPTEDQIITTDIGASKSVSFKSNPLTNNPNPILNVTWEILNTDTSETFTIYGVNSTKSLFAGNFSVQATLFDGYRTVSSTGRIFHIREVLPDGTLLGGGGGGSLIGDIDCDGTAIGPFCIPTGDIGSGLSAIYPFIAVFLALMFIIPMIYRFAFQK